MSILLKEKGIFGGMEMPLIHPSPHAKNALPTWGQYASDTVDEDARDWWAAMKFVFFAEDKEYMPAYHWAMPPPTPPPNRLNICCHLKYQPPTFERV